MTKSMNLADLLKSRLEARKSAAITRNLPKKSQVRLSRLVYFVEEAILRYEVSDEVCFTYAQGHRLADVLTDMEMLHDIKWVSREKYEDLVLRIITEKAAIESFKSAFDIAYKEYSDLRDQIEIQEAKLLKLREQMAHLVE